jgi:hypothetical protein
MGEIWLVGHATGAQAILAKVRIVHRMSRMIRIVHSMSVVASGQMRCVAIL